MEALIRRRMAFRGLKVCQFVSIFETLFLYINMLLNECERPYFENYLS